MRDGKELGSLVLSGTSLHCYCSVLSAIYGPRHKALNGNLEFQIIVIVVIFVLVVGATLKVQLLGKLKLLSIHLRPFEPPLMELWH